jgi:hypothetical protein
VSRVPDGIQAPQTADSSASLRNDKNEREALYQWEFSATR